eukprot:4633465-Pyramimonas_sp.AAC.1
MSPKNELHEGPKRAPREPQESPKMDPSFETNASLRYKSAQKPLRVIETAESPVRAGRAKTNSPKTVGRSLTKHLSGRAGEWKRADCNGWEGIREA